MPQIKFLNKFASSNITQEFSLAVFSLTLKQSIIIVQGVIVCLFVIQFTRYSFARSQACRSRLNFLILSRNFQFVKPFFDLFFGNFHDFAFLRAVSQPFIGKLAYISIPLPDCQALFYKFRHFFLVVLTAHTCPPEAELFSLSLRLSLSGFPEFFAHFSQFFFDFFHVSYYNVGLYDSFD